MKKVKPVKKQKISGVPLGTISLPDRVGMLSRTSAKTKISLYFSWSSDGINFFPDEKKVEIKTAGGKSEKIKDCQNFSISVADKGFVMVYSRIHKTKDKSVFVFAESKNLYKWKIVSEIPIKESHRATIVYDKNLDAFELYKDGLFVKNQSTKKLSVWKDELSLLFTSRKDSFDDDKILVIGALQTERGIFVVYDASVQHGSKTMLQAGGVLFDYNDPRHIIWRSSSPLWQGIVETKKSAKVSPVGFAHLGNQFIIYWTTGKDGFVIGTFPAIFKGTEIHQYKILKKFEKNPIIRPRENHMWEAAGTFNPSVFQDDDHSLHLFYRAVGSDGISRIGYAKSDDGMHFTKRSPYPVFTPTHGFGMPDEKTIHEPIGYNPAYYTSGGGWGGSEDPRVVKIGDRIYMLYVAFEGWNSVRIALTSISVDDFRAGKWKWKKPILISPPKQINKNWVIFPEKVNGKYAILHSIAPKIMVEYVDDLDNFKEYINSPRLEGPQPGRETSWDNLLRGAGPPPIKTDLGWLLLYHALDKRESHKYKLGAMILDKDDPTKILYRSQHSILYPEMWYENEGKPGIVYASGAAVIEDDLYVYYGGGDRVVCVATTDLNDFLQYLKSGSPEKYQLNKVFVPMD